MNTNPYLSKRTTNWVDRLNTWIGTILIGSVSSLGSLAHDRFYHRHHRRTELTAEANNHDQEKLHLARSMFRMHLTRQLSKRAFYIAALICAAPTILSTMGALIK